ncbi:MAG: ABC transporter ATP-binding protein [Planctomycetota bacterium]|nr:MAG: ABC transporter ATP-binding protein [Planctomycetota bacterium]
MTGKSLQGACREAMDAVGLDAQDSRPVRQFSGGMKRRLNVACGFVHRPALLLLDEPTVGVDPQSRRHILDRIGQWANEGTAILFSTHYLEEAEALCSRLAVVDHGRILVEGDLPDLRRQVGERDFIELQGRFPDPELFQALTAWPGLELLNRTDHRLTLAVAEGGKRLPNLFQLVEKFGGEVHHTGLRQPSLETLFIQLTGRALRS